MMNPMNFNNRNNMNLNPNMAQLQQMGYNNNMPDFNNNPMNNYPNAHISFNNPKNNNNNNNNNTQNKKSKNKNKNNSNNNNPNNNPNNTMNNLNNMSNINNNTPMNNANNMLSSLSMGNMNSMSGNLMNPNNSLYSNYKTEQVTSWVNNNSLHKNETCILENEVKAWLYCWLMKRKIRPDYDMKTLGIRPNQKFECSLTLAAQNSKSQQSLVNMGLANINVTTEGLREVGLEKKRSAFFRKRFSLQTNP